MPKKMNCKPSPPFLTVCFLIDLFTSPLLLRRPYLPLSIISCYLSQICVRSFYGWLTNKCFIKCYRCEPLTWIEILFNFWFIEGYLKMLSMWENQHELKFYLTFDLRANYLVSLLFTDMALISSEVPYLDLWRTLMPAFVTMHEVSGIITL